MAAGETVEESVMFRFSAPSTKLTVPVFEKVVATVVSVQFCDTPTSQLPSVAPVQNSVTGVTILLTSLIVFGVLKSSEYPLGDPLIRFSVGVTFSASEFAV